MSVEWKVLLTGSTDPAAFWRSAYKGVRAERDRARSVAARLEQELAEVQKWRAWYATGEAPSPSEWRHLDQIMGASK